MGIKKIIVASKNQHAMYYCQHCSASPTDQSKTQLPITFLATLLQFHTTLIYVGEWLVYPAGWLRSATLFVPLVYPTQIALAQLAKICHRFRKANCTFGISPRYIQPYNHHYLSRPNRSDLLPKHPCLWLSHSYMIRSILGTISHCANPCICPFVIALTQRGRC